ncbi:acyl-ACP thioesterase domain-containing protein, partial [Methanocalculus natronophilus]|uniref:acyl-ACP thioesterase domain-containing protein n=1 Tax=Methanocalculus natronophilus TaxID=1262400 RepID=UPI0031B5AD20
MFYKTYTVERFNTDTKDELTPSSLFHLLNDIMERNAESYGMGADYHNQRDLAWVLIEYQVNITR